MAALSPIISLAGSVVTAFGYMQRTASNVERPEGAKPRLTNRYRGTSLVGFVMGLIAFLVFLDLSL
jgi:hypothetical protein